MLVTGFPAGAFGTNCYVLASGQGAECVVVDPGMEAIEPLQEVLRAHNLKPVAIALTHGHLDHTWSVTPLCEGYDIPAYLHPDDDAMVKDPASWHGQGIAQMLAGTPMPVVEHTEPLVDGATLDLAGVLLTARHTPGHTQGSVVFTFEHPQAPIMLSGDLLFAGSIGRTDLPGGSHSRLMQSLASVCLPMADETVVLPGHGVQTTIGRERATNPFILELVRGPRSAADNDAAVLDDAVFLDDDDR